LSVLVDAEVREWKDAFSDGRAFTPFGAALAGRTAPVKLRLNAGLIFTDYPSLLA
jgi:hypothetical protein